MNSRKYCSVECRQQLRRQLNRRTGLLKALNTQYATFYFTDTLIILDVLVFDSDRMFSYVHSRLKNGKPVDDFIRMANRLGREWWLEQDRTQKRYLATRRILENATATDTIKKGTIPVEMKKPALNKSFLVCLDLSREELTSPDAITHIKSAFRKQAKRTHPDHGGSAASFRRLHEAYNELIRWADQPVFTRRRGFFDKWFYESITNRWVQPMAK